MTMRGLLFSVLSLQVLASVTAFGIAGDVNHASGGTAALRSRQRSISRTTTSRQRFYASRVDAAAEFEWNQQQQQPPTHDTTLSLQVKKTPHQSLSTTLALQKGSKRERLLRAVKAFMVKTLSLSLGQMRSRPERQDQQQQESSSPTALLYQSERPRQQPEVERKPLSEQKSPLKSPLPPPESNDDEEKEENVIVDKNDANDAYDDDADGATLGDIMGTLLVTDSMADVLFAPSPGIKTKPSTMGKKQHDKTTLAELYGIHHPLDRMALTANGNLQRLVSSYYDAPVSVSVVECTARPSPSGSSSSSSSSSSSDRNSPSIPSPPPTKTAPMTMPTPLMAVVSKTWDRLVHLSVHDQVFCTARSVIAVTDPLCVKLIDSGQVGIGQLFRYLDLLPEFVLLGAGPISNSKNGGVGEEEGAVVRAGAGGGGAFWRDYTLQSTSISCHIYEEFCPNLWQLPPK